MRKGFLLSLIGAVTFTGCAGLSYQEQCVAELTEPAKPSKIEAASTIVRDNYVHTERVYYNGETWVMFANKGPRTDDLQGPAAFITGQGDFTRDRTFNISEVGLYEGDYEISQTRPGCYSIADEQANVELGFLLKSWRYPYSVKGEDESTWTVDYFDYYMPFRLKMDGTLTLTHPNAETLVFDDTEGLLTVNGEAAQVVTVDVPFADQAYQVTETGDTYLILGMQRRPNDARYYVLKNNDTLLAYTGPQR
ncbi:hypothetical protein [Reinekea blandensis]|uniref:Lipoprotein n=1 Tax=Reinekea blandensis MED297 TaxID=314283 RepID=A4BIL2_9GAMM|nr:hypothetical protein [Reinekea blandensis]EAR08091.1 hypothetical protein MED297_07606 [Reinekea sp. MED297] [Reinekea blandensis MED297]